MPRGPRGERCPVDVIGNPVREKLCESQAAKKRGKARQPRGDFKLDLPVSLS